MTAQLRLGACLSLTGRFARFGRQAAAGLETWRALTGAARLVIEDDASDRQQLERVLPSLASRCDLMLGPYSTLLTRAAGSMAAEHGWLIWNQGGSGDDVQSAHPGHVVSVLTPASRYTEPFLQFIASKPARLIIVRGAGSFGRQVAEGAIAIAARLGIDATPVLPDDTLPAEDDWILVSAGVFEDDARLVARAQQLPQPPRYICAVAAGVREFSQAVDDTEGVFGIAQWFPGTSKDAKTGPPETDFLRRYADTTGNQPDYPAVQAAVGAALAVHCAHLAGSPQPADLWNAATSLETSTLFGAFGVDHRNGTQVRHQTVLLRWERSELEAVR